MSLAQQCSRRIDALDEAALITDAHLSPLVANAAYHDLAEVAGVMGESDRFIRGLGGNFAWDGIMVAVIANNGIVGTLGYGLFFAALQTGALGMELITALPGEFIQVLQALTVLLVVAGRGGLREALAGWWARWRLHRSVEQMTDA